MASYVRSDLDELLILARSRRELLADWLQVEYFKKQRVVNYQREQTIKRIEAQGGDIAAPQLPLPGSK
jgi:hypothetical protein